ncbi:hypothetical protein BDZ91DRAFT_737940 [Kalaharituber pfeilii]|nr:hypothetical protein BDZ91DRAFT_737940 [Kalaharituber pfeilii]
MYYPAPQQYYPAPQTYCQRHLCHPVPVPGLDTGRPRRKKPNTKGSELPPLTNQPHELHTPRELVAAAEIEESYFETRIKQVEFGKWEAKGPVRMTRPCPACLVVLEVNFQPSAAGGAGLKNSEKCGKKRRWRKEKVVRFTEATLELEFEDASHDPPVSNPGCMAGPTILGFEPTLVTGAPSTAIQTTNFALQVGANPAGADQLIPGLRVPLPMPCLNASFVTTSTSPTTSAAAIHGTLRSHPPRRVVWAIQENEVEKSGVPRRMKVAIIVGYVRGRRFLMRAGMRATVVGRKDGGGLGTWIWGGSGAGKVQVVAGRDDEPVYFEDDYSRRVSSRATTVYCGKDKSNNGEMGAGQETQVSEMKNLRGGVVSVQVPARATGAVGNAAGGMDMHQSSWRKWVPAATVNGAQVLSAARRGSHTSFESSATLVGEQGPEARKERDDMNADRDLNGVDLKELTRMKGWSWNM